MRPPLSLSPYLSLSYNRYLGCSSPTCLKKLYCDGNEYGLTIVNPRFAMSNDLIISFESSFAHGGGTYAAFAAAQQALYDKRYDSKSPATLSRAEVGLAVRLFRSLIDWRERDHKTCCPTCKDKPQVIIMDGTAIGTHKDKMADLPDVRPPPVDDVIAEGLITVLFVPCLHGRSQNEFGIYFFASSASRRWIHRKTVHFMHPRQQKRIQVSRFSKCKSCKIL